LQVACGADLERELRRCGIRVTAQRSVILETVAHLGRHASALEVFQRARRRLPGLNQATVYRILDNLHRAGMIDFLDREGEPLRYSLRDRSSPHCHLVCRRCGKVMEVDADDFRRLARSLERSHGFAAEVDHLSLTGLCRACRRSQPAVRRS
jgi:Fur family ferric uptake transcriptional regulator